MQYVDEPLLKFKLVASVANVAKLKSASYIQSMYIWLLEEQLRYMCAGYRYLTWDIYTNENTIRAVCLDHNKHVEQIIEKSVSPVKLKAFVMANKVKKDK